MNSV
jgi:hypothetical protein